MKKPFQTYQIADFALDTAHNDLSEPIVDQLKRHLLDAVGSMLFATDKPPVQKLVAQLRFLGEGGPCSVPIIGKLPLDRAAQFYTALIRYPDFMDNYMGKEATCHPSDNLGPLLSIAQHTDAMGKDFLVAMAVAYQLQCRLVNEIPVMKEGIDHTLLLSYSMVAGIARLLRLNREQTAHALAISGCSIAPMVSSRASYTSEWKGFASSMDALDCVNNTLLAMHGMTGPIALFEGPKRFADVFDMKLDYNWSKETFELIPRCVLKRYNAEVHSQSSIDAAIELRTKEDFKLNDVEQIEVVTFLTAYHIIGGGAYGDRTKVYTKEQADHSLPYLIAVALLDGDIYPEQFEEERINRSDVQELLQKVVVKTKSPIHKPVMLAGILDPYTEAYPDKVKTAIHIKLRSGHTLHAEREDYPGFFTRPFSWEDTTSKFKRLTGGLTTVAQQAEIINIIRHLETRSIQELIQVICS